MLQKRNRRITIMQSLFELSSLCPNSKKKHVKELCQTTMDAVRMRYLGDVLCQKRITTKSTSKTLLSEISKNWSEETCSKIYGLKKQKRNLRDKARVAAQKSHQSEDGCDVPEEYRLLWFKRFFADPKHPDFDSEFLKSSFTFFTDNDMRQKEKTETLYLGMIFRQKMLFDC